MNPRLFHFTAGESGHWRILDVRKIIGETLPSARHLEVSNEPALNPHIWTLKGVTSNERYVTRSEKEILLSKQEGLGRASATRAALIPIRKTPEWWSLTQDERRDIFEAQSKHTHIGIKYLPAIARKLHHSRDLSTQEPFDFLTWFEFRPEDEPAFDELLLELRSSPEWKYVEREVDIRLER